MNPYNIFDKQEIEKIERIEPLQDREYTKDEIVRMENKILLDKIGRAHV